MLPTCITHSHNPVLNWNSKEYSLDAFLVRQSTTDFAWEMQNDVLWDKGLHIFQPNCNRVMGYYSVSLHYDKYFTGNFIMLCQNKPHTAHTRSRYPQFLPPRPTIHKPLLALHKNLNWLNNSINKSAISFSKVFSMEELTNIGFVFVYLLLYYLPDWA